MRARDSILCLSLSLALALAAAARADEKAPTLPLNPFAKAKKGDWVAANVRRDMKRGNVTSTTHDYVTFKVTSVKDGKVTVEIDAVSRREMGAQDANPSATFSAKEKDLPPLAEYLRLLYYFEKTAATLDPGVKVEDAKRTATGKEFAGKKLAWTGAGGEAANLKRRGSLWVSSATKLGLVAMVAVRGNDDVTEELGMRIVGFGSEGKTEWGKTMDDARKDEANKDLMSPAIGEEDRKEVSAEGKKAE